MFLSSAPRRLAGILLSLLALVLGLIVATGSSASALVGPYVTKHANWGVCTLYIGTVPRSDGGAVGGTDVWCPSARGRIAVSVSLWRYNGYGWVQVGSGSQVTTGVRSAQAQTYYPSYIAGCASWDVTATVNVDGSQISLDYMTWQYPSTSYPQYDPSHRYC
jgi:hypothetical protein